MRATAVLLVCAALASGGGMAANAAGRVASGVDQPEFVELPAGTFRYRASGEFTRGGRPVGAPLLTATINRPLTIMKYQVTAAEYKRCVEALACPRLQREDARSDFAVTGVSWRDAHVYASWLSQQTGQRFRLPTDQEWAYAAGTRFSDDLQPETVFAADPGRRALAIYDREASRQATDREVRPVGSFGANENGLFDLAGNVWEWTDTCFVRTVHAERAVTSIVENCGVRVVEGRHRTYVADFIRDARVGGCVVGTPPANLGFRLVRDGDPWRSLRLLFSGF